MSEDLIYIIHERSISYATRDFEEAINKAFGYDNYLVIYDLGTNTVLLDFYCSYDSIYELESELIDLEALIPDWSTPYYKLVKRIDAELKRMKEHNQKQREEAEYQIYLKVKERLENNS